MLFVVLVFMVVVVVLILDFLDVLGFMDVRRFGCFVGGVVGVFNGLG